MYLGIAVPIVAILMLQRLHMLIIRGIFLLSCYAFSICSVKHDVKATLTLQSTGTSGGEGPRTHVQVFANSLVATVFTILHTYQLKQREENLLDPDATSPQGHLCYNWPGDLLIVGIIANYAVVTADTLGSELGILSKSEPRLITSFLRRKVPPGTNGGVSLVGLAAGFLGSMAVVGTAMFFLPLCSQSTGFPWTFRSRGLFMWGLSFWGVLGSLVDSLLGAVFQRTVADARTGKVIEGEGGVRVPVTGDAPVSPSKDANSEPSTDGRYDAKNKHRTPSYGTGKPSRIAISGFDLLDNNDVNFLMALMMSVGAMAVAAWIWEVPLSSALVP
ncbi:Transmembrane protein 19 [Ceratocystis platani]|uniref:Transmembrane protein 19 n=1 Tax=Ceratocystis fimbriata f. sp. platani TaxID=88771 RepID=A0A0F8DMZ1_CERFI|nr:Transmembrane protein 19 [Ceratocystis platani]